MPVQIPEDRSSLVRDVFSAVAGEYDLMNDLMSFGLHRYWKSQLLQEMRPQGKILLDLAGGTGDIARMFLKAGGAAVTVCDFNQEMLERGRATSVNHPDIFWIQGDAHNLPFADNSNFHYGTISFGIRNFSNIPKALQEMHRVLRPCSKISILEFSHVSVPIIRELYTIYNTHFIPKLGEIVANNRHAYEYLVESIRLFPKPQLLAHYMQEAGFVGVRFKRLSCGIVAVHTGYKP